MVYAEHVRDTSDCSSSDRQWRNALRPVFFCLCTVWVLWNTWSVYRKKMSYMWCLSHFRRVLSSALLPTKLRLQRKLPQVHDLHASLVRPLVALGYSQTSRLPISARSTYRMELDSRIPAPSPSSDFNDSRPTEVHRATFGWLITDLWMTHECLRAVVTQEISIPTSPRDSSQFLNIIGSILPKVNSDSDDDFSSSKLLTSLECSFRLVS
jgi:hypothetical protein